MRANIIVVNTSIMLLAISLLAGCSRGPMPPTQESFSKVADNLERIGKNVTAKEIANGKASDDGKKALMKKSFVEPFEMSGYDLDATLKDFAVRLRDGNYTQEQSAVIVAVMGIYKEQALNLASYGLIKKETKDLMASVLNK